MKDYAMSKYLRDRAILEGTLDENDVTVGGDAAETMEATGIVSALIQAAGGVGSIYEAGKAKKAAAAAAAKGGAAKPTPTPTPKPTEKKKQPWYVEHPYMTLAGGVVGVGLVGTLLYKLFSRAPTSREYRRR
jgi:hypothetical protein